MPKLIIGGVDYGAYPTDAGDISYDNTSSGLSATKVQGAIDETYTSVTTEIGDLSTLTTSDKSSLVGAVNSMVIKSNASWTANSTSAYGTALTESINVTAGVWLITWGHPTQSNNLSCYVDGISTNSDITNQFMTYDNGVSHTKGCILVGFTGNSTITLCAGSSTSVTFTNTERGFLRAVKLK